MKFSTKIQACLQNHLRTLNMFNMHKPSIIVFVKYASNVSFPVSSPQPLDMHNRSLKYCVQGLQNVELAYHGWLLFMLKQSFGNKRRIETSNRKIKKAEIANNLQRTQPVSVPAPFGFAKACMPKIPNAFQIVVVTYNLLRFLNSNV